MRPRAVVTGAAARVGRAIAIELARSGFDVAIHHRSQPVAAAAVAQECEALGASAFVVASALDDETGCDALVDAVKARWDRVHLLVNNASRFDPLPFGQIDAAAWDAMLAVNLRAPFLISRGLLPLLERGVASDLGGPDGQGGCVVHLCDIGAERPVSGYAHYSVSKAGLVMLVRAMAVELAPRVRTVGVSPGQVVWPETYDEARRARLAKRIPMGRVGTAEDVARLVRFIAAEGFYLNGAILPVDGGLSSRY